MIVRRLNIFNSKMSEDKVEVDKVKAFIPVNESIVRQASEFLDSHGKSEMALIIRTLLDEKTSCIKNHLAFRLLDSSSLPNDDKISEVRYCSVLIRMISIDWIIFSI